MTDQIDIQSTLRMVDSLNFSRVYPAGEHVHPSGPPDVDWLGNFLRLWSWQVGAFVDFAEEARKSGGDPEAGQGEITQSLLDSLAETIEVLLNFKREGRPIEVPARFSQSANALLALSEGFGLRGKGRTIAQIARRLSAAGGHPRKVPRPVEVDEQGRVFEVTGERIFGFEPATVRESRRDIAAGRTHSLEGLRAAESRDGP